MSVPSWKNVWRKGIAPQLTVGALVALKQALLTDDVRLLQGATIYPPALANAQEEAVEAACALGYCGWKGQGLDSVGDATQFFDRLCFESDQAMGDPGAIRHFLNWFDDTPRPEMRRQLLIEVQMALDARKLATVRWRLNGATPQEDGPMGLAEAAAHAKKLNDNPALSAKAEVVEMESGAAAVAPGRNCNVSFGPESR